MKRDFATSWAGLCGTGRAILQEPRAISQPKVAVLQFFSAYPRPLRAVSHVSKAIQQSSNASLRQDLQNGGEWPDTAVWKLHKRKVQILY